MRTEAAPEQDLVNHGERARPSAGGCSGVRVGWAAMAMAVGAVWGMTAQPSPRGLAFVRASKRTRDLALIV